MYIHRVWVCAGMSMHSSQVWGDGTEGCVYLGYSYFGGRVFMGWGSYGMCMRGLVLGGAFACVSGWGGNGDLYLCGGWCSDRSVLDCCDGLVLPHRTCPCG